MRRMSAEVFQKDVNYTVMKDQIKCSQNALTKGQRLSGMKTYQIDAEIKGDLKSKMCITVLGKGI